MLINRPNIGAKDGYYHNLNLAFVVFRCCRQLAKSNQIIFLICQREMLIIMMSYKMKNKKKNNNNNNQELHNILRKLKFKIPTIII